MLGHGIAGCAPESLLLRGRSAPAQKRGVSLPGTLLPTSLSCPSGGWSLWQLSVALRAAPCSLPRPLQLPERAGGWVLASTLPAGRLGSPLGAAGTRHREAAGGGRSGYRSQTRF